MKNAILLPLGLTLLITIVSGFRSDKVLIANNHAEDSVARLTSEEKVDGDQLIETLILQRFNFNKALIKNGFDPNKEFPKSLSIVNSSPTRTISFNGFDYLIRKNKVIDVKNIRLSESALATITAKIVALDLMQQYCSIQANLAYRNEKRDLNNIKTLDRHYFAALRAFKIVTSNIANLASKSNASVAIETAVAKIKMPDVKMISTKTERNGSYVAEIE